MIARLIIVKKKKVKMASSLENVKWNVGRIFLHFLASITNADVTRSQGVFVMNPFEQNEHPLNVALLPNPVCALFEKIELVKVKVVS